MPLLNYLTHATIEMNYCIFMLENDIKSTLNILQNIRFNICTNIIVRQMGFENQLSFIIYSIFISHFSGWTHL